MRTLTPERQGLNGANSIYWQWPIQVREQRSAARRLPFERIAKTRHLHRHQYKIILAGEMFRCRLFHLGGGRKMDITVPFIDWRTMKYTRLNRLLPGGTR